MYNPTDIEKGIQRLKKDLAKIIKKERNKALNNIDDTPIDVTPGYHEKVLKECLDIIERNSKNKPL